MRQFWQGLALLMLITGPALVPARADDSAELRRLMGRDSTVSSAAATPADDGTIRLTPDRTKTVQLDQDAASIIVANPMHAAVIMDSPRILVIMPRQPGSTAFTALDRNGKVIFEKNIIVTTTAEPSYVRIRRMCPAGSGSGAGCVPSAYYYCPDGCYEVQSVPGSPELPVAPAVAGNPYAGGHAEDEAMEEFEEPEAQPQPEAPMEPLPPGAPQ